MRETKLTTLKEEINNRTIELYIDKLVASYGIYPIVKETALKIQFDHNLFSECVIEIMKKMGLSNKIRVTCYADYKYPCSTSAARISLPMPMPVFGSVKFNTFQMHIEIKDSIRKNFYAFVSSIAHELSHVIMFGTNHELRESEVATDLCMLVFGFSDFVRKGKNVTQWTVFGNKNITLGYLSTSQLNHAVNYINHLRLKIPKAHSPNKKVDSIEKLIKIFKKLF